MLSSETANPATFTMPAGNVEIKAEFETFNGFAFMTDPTFKTYCERFDTNPDGILSQAEAGAVTEINVRNSLPSIESLAGIEIFTNLIHLDCNLSALDVSNLAALTHLDCVVNNLSALDVSNNAALDFLFCTDNNLSAEAIRNIFGSLPDRQNLSAGSVVVSFNPGLGDITLGDMKVAADKNWTVTIS